MVKIQEKNKQYTITLTKDVVELVGWKKGDDIVPMPDQYRKDIILVRKIK